MKISFPGLGADVLSTATASRSRSCAFRPVGPQHEVFASTTAVVARERGQAGTGCVTLISLRVGTNRYLLYELSGSL